MNINGINRNNSLNGVYESQIKDNQAKHEKNSSAKKTDKIEVSAEAKNLSVIDFSVNKVKTEMHKDTISPEKLHRLRESIKNGLYNPNSKNIAKAMAGAVLAD